MTPCGRVRLYAASLVSGRSIRRTLNGRSSLVRRIQYDPNRKSTRPKSIDIKATVNVSLDGLAALTTTRAPPQKRAAGSAAPVYASMHTTTVSGSTPS